MLGKLLDLMSDGDFHSGEWLGQQLGVSRAAVWKSLKKLEEDGYPLYSVRGRGYCAPKGASLLDAERIIDRLPEDCRRRWEWRVVNEIDSTNAEAHRLVGKLGPHPLVVTSEQQRSGRGRRGRSWASPYGQNIYLTVVEPFEAGAQSLEGLSLVVGLALVEALEDAGYAGCQLKWPNDVLLDGSKLAGILIEIAGDLSAECVAVIGVGVNVLMSRSEHIDQQWTSLFLSDRSAELDRNRLIALFLARLHEALEIFRRDGFSSFVRVWSERDAWLGRMVRVVSGDNATEGIDLGVNDSGALRLSTGAGEVAMHGGEVSLRLVDAS
ncbi:BirA family transcriptional regulator, biotin operon repressor / biotin-[acetyl-CoA-carboxylase] ligase [Halopseudomonas xinjiangensis]|uniref:Bifunctional ligase/repressor BirA n=1 Tax=Halopseudomonas xinjiangensis TaxID=487184 RepID=A0A1H1WUP1_9GAMM|nr:biotin--[acetyl-CoA-carboxylase] ligase [Halopseudomonas xinjiangensis]SDT00998.1 BirA family transcriptional regulator, biotin operon repressor / biotin-[acetyl-CoA-carboxylase] ligase [Halopseudomonas xinjiangensis]